MNYLLMFKDKVVNSVNDYVVTPVNDYLVTPIITNPINNYIVNPIQHLVRRDVYTYIDSDLDTLDTLDILDTLDANTYTTFTSYPASISSTPLLDKPELTYFENIQEKMYYSGVTLKASMFFFVNAWFPNTFKDKGHNVLENLKKND